MTTLMAIVEACENVLGWQPPYRRGVPTYRIKALEVAKLKNAMALAPPSTTTIENLALALEYSRRKKLPISCPATLVHRIPDALKLAYQPPAPSELAVQIVAAINAERDLDDQDSLRWIHRLARAQGDGRRIVLTEWAHARLASGGQHV